MNKFASITALALCLITLPAFAISLGQPAPAFTGTDSAGKKVSLADFKGKTVVLEWTSSECPFVHKHYDSGNMQNIQKAAAADGVVWLAIDSSAPGNPGYMKGPDAAAWMAKENAAPADILIDDSGEIGHLYGAKATPTMVIIDKTGNLAYFGAIDSIPSADPAHIAKANNYVTAALAALKNGTPVSPAVTVAYGCSVKY